jgi:predicted O-methyltransferase YrrM
MSYNPAENKIQGWMNDRELIYLYSTVLKQSRMREPLKVLEIGSWKGRSTHALISALATLSSYSILYCVDDWSKADHKETDEIRLQAQTEFCNNITALSQSLKYENINTRNCSSHYAAMLLSDVKFDVIFLDADHSYEAVKQDLKLWWPLLNVGGVFLGHDFVAGRETLTNQVRKAVWEKFKKSEVRLIPGGSIYRIDKRS